MKKTKLLILVILIISGFKSLTAQVVCDSTANIVIYSNYDGGVLNINVDEHIPNLKIGVVTYEPVTINISGTYVADVTGVIYAGYVSTTNHHCNNSPATTTITGVASNITSINFLPAVSYNNPDGYSMIVCNTSCSDTTDQGGCNTPDQVVYYFENAFSGTFRYHFTQYGCWNTTPYLVSSGGNCCAAPVTTSNHEIHSKNIKIFPTVLHNNDVLNFIGIDDNSTLSIADLLGREIKHIFIGTNKQLLFNIENITKGMYFYMLLSKNGGVITTGKLIVE